MIGVARPREAPPSLMLSAAQDRYRNPDVVDALAATFHDKCYICELKPVTDPVVEHLRPHRQGRYQDRKFDWNNLFYSCSHCNLLKERTRYAVGVVDCCRRDPEELLAQRLDEGAVAVDVLVEGDVEADCTAGLIEDVFNVDKRGLRSKAADARIKALQLTMNVLLSQLALLKDTETSALAERTVGAMLSRGAKFAGFTRQYVRDHIDEYPQLKAYLED